MVSSGIAGRGFARQSIGLRRQGCDRRSATKNSPIARPAMTTNTGVPSRKPKPMLSITV